MIHREVLLSHSEAVATFRVDVQFGRFVGGDPLLVQENAYLCESEFVVGGSGHKHGRRIRWNRSIFKLSTARVYGSHEGGPAFRQVMEGDSSSDRSTSGESHNADTVGGNSPFRRVLPNVGDCRQPIG